jgi:hypothetical protein
MRGISRAVTAALVVGGVASLNVPAQAEQTPDLIKPTIAWVASSISTGEGSIAMSWSAADELSGVLGTDVRWRSRTVGGAFGPWHRPERWQGLGADAGIEKAMKTGRIYQFNVRAHDLAGNTSAWEPLGGGTPVTFG